MIRRKLHILYALIAAWIVGFGSTALAAPVVVGNASFEAPDLSGGGATWTNEIGPEWALGGADVPGNSFIELIPGLSSDGAQHIGLEANNFLFQDTGVAVEPNTTYTLRVGIGNRDAGNSPAGALAIIGLTNVVPDAADANAALAFLAASVSVDSGAQDPLSVVDAVVTFTTGAGVDGTVVIVLGDDVSAGRAHFDNVRLDATPAYVVNKSAGTIVADGDLSDWSDANQIVNPEFTITTEEALSPFGQRVTHEEFGGTWDGLDDHSATVMALYDDESVYLAIVVTDDYHENSANSAWNGDSAQLMIANGARDAQVSLLNYALGGVDGALGDLINMAESVPADAPATTAGVTRDGTTTTYEICVPKATAGLAELVEGTAFGFAVSINDGDEATPGQKGWSGVGPGALVRGKNANLTDLFILGTTPVPPVLADGLVNYWNFDNNLDDSAHGAAGTASSSSDVGSFDGANGTDGISYSSGIFGGAIDTNGATGDNQNDGYVRVPRSADTLFGANATNPGAPNTVTTSLWIKATGFDTGWQTILSHGEGAQYRFARRGTDDPNVAAYAGGSGDIPSAAGGPTINPDTGWHHVVGISEGGVSTRLWVDGELVATGDAPVIDDARSDGALDLFIGGNPDTGDQNREWFGGIDDVAQWNRALSDGEIATIWKGGAGSSIGSLIGSAGTPLIACWSFDGSANDDLAGIVGTPSAGVTYSSDAVRGKSMTGGSVSVTDVSVFNAAAANDQLSVSFWQKTTATPNASSFWFRSPSSDGGERAFQAHVPWSNSIVYFDTAGCCAAPQRINANPTGFNGFAWDDGQFHHYAFVKDGENKQIYIDGALFLDQSSVEGPAGALPADITSLWIGSAIDGASQFAGLIDDFAVWGGALTTSEIAALATGANPKTLGGAVFTGPDPDLDGLLDSWEIANLGNTDSGAADDNDEDGLTNKQEFRLGTNPLVADTDGDGLSDGEEYALGINPNNPDTDGDGVSDADEIAAGTFAGQWDSNGDGFPDGQEASPTPANGLLQQWWLNGNPGTRSGLEEVFAGAPNAVFYGADNGGTGTWWTGDGGEVIPGVQDYSPAQSLVAAGGDLENYLTRLTGQILFPEDGNYKFRDGVDDYTFVFIDLNGNGVEDEGEVLIDDNAWTGPATNDNGGSPIAEVTATAGWVDIVMYTGEGGGGDAGVLYWDYDSVGGIGAGVGFPAALEDAIDLAANGAALLVPESNLRPPSVKQGLQQEWWLNGNPGNRAGMESVFGSRPANASFNGGDNGGTGTWWTGDGGEVIPGVQDYSPAQSLVAAGGDLENYLTRLTGQILFPEDGNYKFRDGVDDYTFVFIDLNGNGVEDEGEVLIDDNAWTGPATNDNGGSPIAEVTATAGWVDIVMYTGEGGGGDAGVLYWDYDSVGGIGAGVGFPAALEDAIDLTANAAALLIPESNLRLPIDSDGDGMLDFNEYAWFGDLSQTLNDDSDGDRAINADELAMNTNPSIKDTDGDGLWDGEEWIEAALATLPSVADTDGDGLSDGTELRITGTNPNDPDTDNDGLTDGFEFANSCLYSQNFNHLSDGTTDLGDGSMIVSNDPFQAAVSGKALELTRDGIDSQNAAYLLPNLGDIGGDFAVAFDYTLSGGGARPADGFSFNFGQIADGEQAGTPEEGYGKGLAVEFDVWDGGPDDDLAGSGIGIDLSLDGATVAFAREEAGADPIDNAFFVFDGSTHKVEIIAAAKFESELPSPQSLFKLDFGNTTDSPGPANGTADGWDGIDNLAMDTAVGVTDQNGVVSGVTITALDDGFNPNNSGAPGAGASYDGVSVPQNVTDDYLFKITDTAGTSARIRVDGLAGGVYNVTLFEGRTTDTGQVATVWAGSDADEPAAANTDSFANGGTTVSVLVTAGDSLFYKHLEDGSGGISGIIIRQFANTETAPELALSPVAFYNFEQANTGTVSDWSGNGNDGTVVNNVNIVIGGAPNGSSRESAGRFSVDGAGHLDVPGIDMVALAQGDASYSFSAWIKPDAESIGGDHFIFGQTAQGVHHGLRGSGTLHTAHWGADSNAATILTADEWIHAVWTYDGTADKAKIYLNGVEDLDFDQQAPNGTGNLIVGGRNGGEANYVGDLDDVAIFDRVLTPAEAESLSAVEPALSPVAFYNFEQADSGTVSDLSGNGNDGTVVNNVSIVAGGAPTGSSPGSAGRFSVGGAGHINVPGVDMVALAQGDNSYSFSAWIKPDAESIGGDHFIFGQTAQGVHNGLRGDGTLHTAHWGADQNAATILTADEWIHAVWTYDGAADKAKIYLNGVEDLDFDQRAPNGSGTLVLGGRNGGEANFIGDLDDIAIFDRVLTPAEAEALATGAERLDRLVNTITVKVDGNIIHDRVVVDFDPTAADRIAFAARTGGAHETLFLDNICVVSGTELPESPSNPLIADPDAILRDPILAASNTVFGGQLGDDGFALGVEGTAGETNNWPGGEAPGFTVDGVGQKYLNFGKFNTGIIVIPAAPSVATAIKVWAANDSPGRDPSSYEVYGSNADLSGAAGTVPSSSFTLIQSGGLALPESRNDGGDAALLESNADMALIGNTATYAAYIVVFPTIKDEGQNSMQLADVQLLGTMDPVVLELLAKDRDSDGDGTTDNAELVAGTDPYNSREFFHVSRISSGLSADGSKTLLIDLATVPGQTYVLQFSPTLKSGTWENVDVITADDPYSAFEIMNPKAFQRQEGYFRSILVEQN